MKHIMTILYLVFTTSGLFLLKSGGDSMHLSFAGGMSFNIGYTTMFGFICYICSFLIWQRLIVTYDITYIFPITTGIIQAAILVLGATFFHEKINWIGIMGVVLVVAGVICITMSKN